MDEFEFCSPMSKEQIDKLIADDNARIIATGKMRGYLTDGEAYRLALNNMTVDEFHELIGEQRKPPAGGLEALIAGDPG